MNLKSIKGDILGGVTACVIALPQALAFGVATGLGAAAGLFGAIILSFVVGFLCRKYVFISGPTAPSAIAVASAAAYLNGQTELIFAVLLMVGAFQIIISLSNAPDIVKYIPYPVISGFMNGIGTIIILVQFNVLFGAQLVSSPIQSILNIKSTLADVNEQTLILSFLTLLIVFALPKKITKFIPSHLIALVFITLLSVVLNFNVDRIGDVPSGLPQMLIPHFDHTSLFTCLKLALVIAIVTSTESLMSLLVVDSLTREKHSSKSMLFSQGVGNSIASLFGGISGSGAAMRSVAAIKTGAVTNFSSIVCGFALLAMLIWGRGFVEVIPLCVLAGILIKIGYDILDTKFLKILHHAPAHDLYVMALVFSLAVFMDLMTAVVAGVLLSALLFAKRVADKTKLDISDIEDIELQKLESRLEYDYNYKIRVVHIKGLFFFASANQIVQNFDGMLDIKYLIMVYERKHELDISAIFALEDIIVGLKLKKIKVLLVLKNENIKEQLDKCGVLAHLKDGSVFLDEMEAIEFAKIKLKTKIKNKIGEQSNFKKPFSFYNFLRKK